MTHISLPCGFETEIDEQVVNDMEFLDLVYDFDAGDEKKIFAMRKMSDILLKPEEKKRLYDILRDENGRVPIDRYGETMAELIGQLNSKKK